MAKEPKSMAQILKENIKQRRAYKKALPAEMLDFERLQLIHAVNVNYDYGSLTGDKSEPYEPPSKVLGLED